MSDNELGALIAVMATVAIVFVTLIRAFANRGRGNTSSAPFEISRIEQRLERIEQSVDAIAIEVERVAEGQRFVSKLMSERSAKEALPAGDQLGR